MFSAFKAVIGSGAVSGGQIVPPLLTSGGTSSLARMPCHESLMADSGVLCISVHLGRKTVNGHCVYVYGELKGSIK